MARVSIGLSAPDLNFVGGPLIPSLVLFRSLSMWTVEQASFASQLIVFQFFSSKWSYTRECLITLIYNYIDISSGKKHLFKVTHSKFQLIIVKDFSFLFFPIDCCFLECVVTSLRLHFFLILCAICIFSCQGQLNNWHCLSVPWSLGRSQLTIRA